MNIDLIPAGANPPHSVNVLIEVPIGGEPVKYEFDKASGALMRMEGYDWNVQIVKRFEVVSAQKIDNRWFLKQMRIEELQPGDITRYRGGNLKRSIVQASPQTNGAYTLVNFEDEVAFPDNVPDIDPAKAENTVV